MVTLELGFTGVGTRVVGRSRLTLKQLLPILGTTVEAGTGDQMQLLDVCLVSISSTFYACIF